MQAVREEYTKEKHDAELYNVMKPLPVQFQNDTEIDISYPPQISGWLLAKKYPGHPV